MLGQDIYTNMPESTDKIMFEGAGDGHGFAAYPYGEVSEYILNWINYQILGDNTSCELLLESPSSASQYITNLDCNSFIAGDINGDGNVNIQDIVLTVNYAMNSDYNASCDLNSDGDVNILDIVLIANIILG